MKKLLVSSLLLLCTAVASWAVDYHFTLSHNGAAGNKKTIVYARLAFGDNGSKYNWYKPGWWEVAAFIDGECRAISKGEWNIHLYSREDYNYNYFPLEVEGNYGSTSDIGKVITFKVYSHRMGLEYNLKTTQTIKFDGETHGDYYSDSSLIPLSCTELRNVGMNDFEMSLNSTVDLASYLILTPSNATIPNNLAFSINPSTYTLTVTGNGGYQFKPTAVGYYGVEGYNIYTDSLISIGFRGGTITVKKPKNYVSGLAINPGYEKIEVNKNDSTGLNDLLKKALKVSYFYPNEDPDEVPEWVSSNTNIVGKNSNGKWVPLKSGTCTMTAQVYNNDGTVRKSASLQVKVVNHVTSIDMKISSFWCNVGDDLTDYLPRTFEVLPADADNKKVTYEITWSSGCLEKRSDGHIVASDTDSGLATITITSVDKSDVTGELTVFVMKVAKDISIQKNPLNISYVGYGQPQDISNEVAANLSFLPLGGSFDSDLFPTITSDNEDVVKVSLVRKDPEPTEPTGSEDPEPVDPSDPANLGYAVEAQALKAGTANLTVTLKVPNNMEWSIQGFGSIVEPTTVTKTFKVVMGQGAPTAISLPDSVVVDYGKTLDLKTLITTTPADATLDYSKLEWSCNIVPWKEYFTIDENCILTTLQPGMFDFELTASVPGTDLKDTTILNIQNKVTSLTVKSGYDTLTVFKGDDRTLTQMVNEAFVITPTRYTDYLMLTSEDEDIVYESREWYPRKPGTTKIYARIYDYSDYKRRDYSKPRFEKYVTVVVKSTVGDISLPATKDMNEGDTLKLDEFVQLTLQPGQTFKPADLVWTVEAGKESLVSIDKNRVLTARSKGVLTLTATVPDTDLTASTVLTIHRHAKEMSIVSGFDTVYVYVGSKQLNAILDDALLVLPLGYTDKVEWQLADDGILEAADGVLTPVKTGTTKVRAYIGDKTNPRLQTAEVTIVVGLRITGIAAKEPKLHLINDVFTRRNYITKTVKDNFVLTPEANLLDYHPVFDSSDKNIVYISTHDIPDEDGLQPISMEREFGTVTMGVTITVPDYDNSTSRTGKPTTKELRAAFQLEIEGGLQGLSVDNVVTHVDDQYILKMKKDPENVEFTFDPSKFKVTFDTYNSRDFPDDWTFAEWEPSSTAPLTIIIKGKCVEYGSLFVYYNGEYMGGASLTVAPRYTLADGWQWFALHNGTMDSQKVIKDALGEKLVEVRSHDGLLTNDPDIGYIGDLEKLETAQTYKLRMQNVTNDGHVFTIDEKVGSVFTGKTLSLKAGWNWIGNIYQYYQSISEVFEGNAFTNGDMVQAKDAFATWNGTGWVGSLKYVTPGQGLLLNLKKAMDVKLKGENRMKQNFTQPAGARAMDDDSWLMVQGSRFFDNVQRSTVGSRFADNMAMIAQVDGVADPLRTTILAFVDDECRGVSVVDAGRLFITIHGNMGERVSFVAYDQLTGLYHQIDNGCMLSQMVGTLEHPFMLHASDATSVEPVRLATGQAEEIYDLQGRKLNVSADKPGKGIYIVRPAGKNGKKMVR